jgi:anti-sigma regulatory factor (Ser/Thr protein kinase)
VTARSAGTTLEPDPLAAREAREFVVDTCRTWGLADQLETVQLLTSELVTNGVLHARTPLGVELRADDDSLTVEVRDHDRRSPVRRAERGDLLADIDELLTRGGEGDGPDERQAVLAVGPAGAIGAGRGLLLVEALADEWGVQEQADGKSVWFRLAITSPGSWS